MILRFISCNAIENMQCNRKSDGRKNSFIPVMWYNREIQWDARCNTSEVKDVFV